MLTLWWILLSVAAAASLWGIFVGPRHRQSERLLVAFTERIDIPATADIVLLVERRIRERSVGQSIGGLAAVLVVALLLFFNPESVTLGIGGFAMMGLIVAATAAGAGVSALRQFPAPRGPAAPRVARLDAPTLGDYVHPAWIWASVIAATAPLPLLAGLLAGGSPGVAPALDLHLAGVAALAVLSLGGVGGAAVLSRRLLAIPQRASDERELQWDDALRAYALRDIWIASVALSSASVVVGLSLTFTDTSPAASLGILVGVIPAFLQALRASRRPSARLWRSAGART